MKIEIRVDIADKTKMSDAVKAVGDVITDLTTKFNQITSGREWTVKGGFNVGYRKPGDSAYFSVTDATIAAGTKKKNAPVAPVAPVAPATSATSATSGSTGALGASGTVSSNDAPEDIEEVEVTAEEVKPVEVKTTKKAAAKKKPADKKKK